MSTISATTALDELEQVLQATGIPFVQTRADHRVAANGNDSEPGKIQTHLEYTGTWTAAQDLALERLMSEGVVTGLERSGPDPFPFEEKLAAIYKAAAIHPALQEKRLVQIENPRYVVHPGRGVAAEIHDTKGMFVPYEIGESQDEREQSEAGRQRSWAFNRSVAEDWAYTWNLVELGHCGLCKRKIAEIPGYKFGPNGEPPRHQHTFGHRMYHALCFDCSCSQDD